MTATVTVREARPDEYERLAALVLEAYEAVLGPDLDSDYAAELADVATRAEEGETLVAVDGAGEIAGCITYVPGPGPLAWFDSPAEAGMRVLAVAGQAQRRGVGAALVGACVDRARAAGKVRLLLHTTASFTVAQRMYERLGFRRDPERDRVLASGLLLLAYVLELNPGR